MSDTIISVEHVSKRYRLHHQTRQRYTALRDVLAEKFKNLLGGGARAAAPETEEDFWALNDVSFTVKRGEVVGIIGRNGAGKSTLLKILSRITEPSSGRICIGGRVASLLEVGTGFHPELTGRENIFLNGAILGMTRAEIRGKFDEIVAFAEVEKFLDTPVKRYSSGMYVRLAFAVAAHLEPEILIVDEVLAVGDAAFQKKCLGKMQDISHHQGRTVLFVSHNLATVKALCRKGILLEQGRVASSGPVEEILERYLCGGESGVHNGVIPDAFPRQFATGEARLRRVQIVNGGDQPVQSVLTGEALRIQIEWEVIRPIASAMVEIGVMDADGRQVTQSLSADQDGGCVAMETGPHEIHLRMDECFFPGRYSLLAGLHKEDGTTVDFVERALDFEVLNTGKGEPNHNRWGVRGYLRPQQQWQVPSRLRNPSLAALQTPFNK